MKKLVSVFILALLISVNIYSQNTIEPRFDERCDLLSMVFRLAGAREFNQCLMTAYAGEADKYFNAFKEHRAVMLAKQYYGSGIGYDAVVSYAMHIKIPGDKTGSITFSDKSSEVVDQSYSRWTDAQKQEFLTALDDFYREADFHGWYARTGTLREEATAAFLNTMGSIDCNWIQTIFGNVHAVDFSIILSMLDGPQNYGCSYTRNDSLYVVPVLGCCHEGWGGKPEYNYDEVAQTVIHELCHPYVNQYVSDNWNLMQNKAESLFKQLAPYLPRQYNTPEIFVDESIVRSAVIQYSLVHGNARNLENVVKEQENAGFVMTRTILKELGAPNPDLVGAVNSFEFENKNASYVCSIESGSMSVPSGLSGFTITFDRPMQENISLWTVDQCQFPEVMTYYWSRDKKTLTVMCRLKPASKYGFKIDGTKFRTLDGHSAGYVSEIVFSTAP